MQAKRKKTAQLSLYIRPELKAAFEKAAERDGLSLTRAAETLLEGYCAAKGVAVQEPAARPVRRRKS